MLRNFEIGNSQLMNNSTYFTGMPNQYHAPPAGSASMYMPHIPGAVTSSPQHQPQVYQQNVNHPSMPPLPQVRSKQ